jgi:hypothetical protein
MQLTEELKELNKLKDNKEDFNDNNENFTSSTLNSNNTLINKNEDNINNLKNKNRELVQELNSKIKEIKELKEANKNYQIELDNNSSEFSKLNSKNKINEQIIILMSSKISSIKSEFKSFQKFVMEKFNIYNKDNQSIVKIINQNLSKYFQNKNLSSNLEVSSSLINTEENNQELYEQIKNYEGENKSLNIKCITYERENQKLMGEIKKLNIEIQVMNKNFNSIKSKNKIEVMNIIQKYKSTMKNKIALLKNKYIQQIGELKTMISVLNSGLKKYNNMDMQYSLNKINEQKNMQLIDEMQQKINKMKIEQEKCITIINKKNKKIKELQGALKSSLVSFSSGMKNIKMANILDNEVKEFLKKNKEINNNENNKNNEE